MFQGVPPLDATTGIPSHRRRRVNPRTRPALCAIGLVAAAAALSIYCMNATPAESTDRRRLPFEWLLCCCKPSVKPQLETDLHEPVVAAIFSFAMCKTEAAALLRTDAVLAPYYDDYETEYIPDPNARPTGVAVTGAGELDGWYKRLPRGSISNPNRAQPQPRRYPDYMQRYLRDDGSAICYYPQNNQRDLQRSHPKVPYYDMPGWYIFDAEHNTPCYMTRYGPSIYSGSGLPPATGWERIVYCLDRLGLNCCGHERKCSGFCNGCGGYNDAPNLVLSGDVYHDDDDNDFEDNSVLPQV